MMQGNDSYGGFNLQGPRFHHHHQQQQQSVAPHHRQGSSVGYPTIHDKFPVTVIGSIQEDQTVTLADYNKLDRVKSMSNEDELSFMEDAADFRNDSSKGKKGSPWQRVKWSDTMVRLLITAVSYISEEAAAEYGSGLRRKYANLQKKGKWKSVSKVMAERGHFVSPQQCEDKFNDLNKRYKRLNEILGRGTSCEVVENPALLDVMDHISVKGKDEICKILSSKHLHYEEMCSYHNGNRLHLPPDPELQRSLRLALRSEDDHDDTNVKRHPNEDNDEVDQEAEFDDHDEYEENHDFHGDHRGYGLQGNSSKRAKPCRGHEDFSFRNKTSNFHAETADSDADKAPSEGKKTNIVLQKQSTSYWNLNLEEQKLHIDAQMLELERERFKWQRFCQKKDRELEMMKMDIERMKLENERMALDLRRKEMGINNN